jgi:vancomycin resistance protein YoaR
MTFLSSSSATTKIIPATVCGAAFFCAMPHAQAAPIEKFGDVNVAGVSINGLNREEATRRLTRELQPKLDTEISLAAGPRELKRRRRDLGIDLNLGWMLARAEGNPKFVPLKLHVDEVQALGALRRLAPNFEIQKREARPVYSGGKVQIRAEQDGIKLNLGGSLVRLQVIDNGAGTKRVVLATHRDEPKVTRAKLKGINAILATYTTRFDPGNVGRTTNVRLGAAAIDGTLLSPGETFSLNDTVGERTQKRGYKEAIIFENGKQVRGLGGGISQVTGTLFNAALLAGLPIVTYRTHSRPVSYIPIGRDATVAWGQFDMKFKNDRDTPIFISYDASGSRATARLFGAKTNQDVSINVASHKIGAREIKAKLYRTIRENGKVVSKAKVGESHYKWKPDDVED